MWKAGIYSLEELDTNLGKIKKWFFPIDEVINQYNVFIYETLRYPPDSSFNTIHN